MRTNLHTAITESNRYFPERLRTVTVRQKGTKVSIDWLTRLLGYRSDGAAPSSSNRETIDQASGRPMDTLIHRPRRPSKETKELIVWLAAIIIWSTIWYIAFNMIMVLNG